MGKNLGRERNMKRCASSLERNIGREDEFLVSGGSEFQSRGPMTEKAFLQIDGRTYGMKRTSESEDRVETECDGNDRLLHRYVGSGFVSVLYWRRQSL